jgi:hypothetical protein
MKKKWVVWISYVVLLLSFLFIIQKFRQYTINLSGLFTVRIGIMVGVCALLYGCTVIMSSVVYQALYRSFSKDYIPPQRIMYVYLQSNLYRYLPGNVLHYLGRNQLATEYKVSHTTVAGVTILEILTLVCSCMAASLVFTFKDAINLLQRIPPLIIIIGAVVLVTAVACLFFLKTPQRWIHKHFASLSRKGLLITGTAVAHRFISFLLFGLIFGTLLQLTTGPLQQDQWPQIIGRYALCWFVGFITPGAPGGIGVRESLLIILFSGVYGESAIIRTALLMRIATILGDVIAFGVASITFNSKHNTTMEDRS